MGHPAYIYQEKARFEYPLLRGKKCRFRDFGNDDYPFLRKLFDEPSLGEALGMDGGILNSPQRINAWIFTKDSFANESWGWLIEDLDGNRIGLAMLENVIFCQRIAGPWIIWIHSDFRRNGYSEDADFILFRFAFDYLNLHKIWTEVMSSNMICLRHMDKVLPWVRKEGILHDEARFNGEWRDLHRFAVFEEMDQWKSYWT